MIKVFLGGTCNESSWREELIKMLEVDYFNPVVEDWNEECYKEELKQREICDYCLYVITPRMTGVYSIGEVIGDSNKRPDKTIFCLLKDTEHELSYDNGFKTYSFTEGQIKSLDRLGLMVQNNGGKYFESLEEVAKYLNSKNRE